MPGFSSIFLFTSRQPARKDLPVAVLVFQELISCCIKFFSMSAPIISEEVLQMDFEGVEAQDSDVPSMSVLLHQLTRESGVDSEQLAKVLVSQNYVGSVLKPCLDDVDMEEDEQPEDQPVFAITSMVNITERQEPVVKDILKFLRKHIRDMKTTVEKDGSIFQEVTSDTGIPSRISLGLLLKERMVNMPVDLLGPSLQSLLGDMHEAIKRKMAYKFTHVMYWSKMYVDKETFHHYDVEDSWFDENALAFFSYPLKYADTVMIEKENEDATTGAQPLRRVYIIEFPKMQAFIDHVKTVNAT